jgi:hypothetical protein
MSDTLKNWLLGVAGTVTVLAAGAALSMWSDMRVMKAAMVNYAQAAQIATVQKDIENLDEDIQELKSKCEHKSLWDAIGRKRDQ